MSFVRASSAWKDGRLLSDEQRNRKREADKINKRNKKRDTQRRIDELEQQINNLKSERNALEGQLENLRNTCGATKPVFCQCAYGSDSSEEEHVLQIAFKVNEGSPSSSSTSSSDLSTDTHFIRTRIHLCQSPGAECLAAFFIRTPSLQELVTTPNISAKL